MHRILVLLALVALGGCVTAPGYRYATGGDYYYADGVYVGGYGAGHYYDRYDAGYYGYYQAWPWYAYNTPGFYFGAYSGWCGSYRGYDPFLLGCRNNLWASSWAGPWGGYFDPWGYTPYYYYWADQSDPGRDRDSRALHAEKVRYASGRRGVSAGNQASYATAGATVSRGARTSRHATRAESLRQAGVLQQLRAENRRSERMQRWAAQRQLQDIRSRNARHDTIRRSVTRPVTPRRTSSPEPSVNRRSIRRSYHPAPQHSTRRIQAAPSRSHRSAPRVRSAPAARVSRSHSSTHRASSRASPRGIPRDRDD